MWNDEPTDDQGADFARGRLYACLAIEALRTERFCSRQLEIIVERMIERAFRRRGPAGKLCRQLSSSEQGFLTALRRVAVEIDLPQGWDGDGQCPRVSDSRSAGHGKRDRQASLRSIPRSRARDL